MAILCNFIGSRISWSKKTNKPSVLGVFISYRDCQHNPQQVTRNIKTPGFAGQQRDERCQCRVRSQMSDVSFGRAMQHQRDDGYSCFASDKKCFLHIQSSILSQNAEEAERYFVWVVFHLSGGKKPVRSSVEKSRTWM